MNKILGLVCTLALTASLLLCAASAGAAVCTPPGHEADFPYSTIVGETQNGQSKVACKGSTLAIVLKEDEDDLKWNLKSVSAPNVVGEIIPLRHHHGSAVVFTFQAVGAGSTTIELEYNGQPAKMYSLTVHVDDAQDPQFRPVIVKLSAKSEQEAINIALKFQNFDLDMYTRPISFSDGTFAVRGVLSGRIGDKGVEGHLISVSDDTLSAPNGK